MARCRVSYDNAVNLCNGVNNAWNVNFSNGNVNNNNRTNTNRVRAVAAFDDLRPFVESFLEAYEDCLKNKRTSPQAVEYMPTAAEDVPRLALEVWERRYKPTTSTCFMVTYPKLREVFAAAFRDRIVHHWICKRLTPLFEARCRQLGDCAHACRVGHGTAFAVKHLKYGIDTVTQNHTREAWIYKGDIVGFFFVIVCDDRDFLRCSIKLIDNFTRRELKLETHMDSVYFQPASHGVKFVGSIIKGDRIYLSNRTLGRMEHAVRRCLHECERGLTPLTARNWRCTINSYYGFMAGTKTWKFRKRLLAMYTDEFFKVFTVVNNKKVTIKKQYKYSYDY